jgi:uncharacterized protein with von Willebrand factor type A (vWA) domain
MPPFASLPENLIAFCAALRRDHGFRIGPGEARDAARALEAVDLADQRVVRDALRPILSGTEREAAVFDRAFTDFIFPRPSGVPQDRLPSTRREPGVAVDGADADAERERQSASSTPDEDDAAAMADARSGPMAIESADEEGDPAGRRARSTWSPLDALGAGAPSLARAEREWREVARSLVRRLEVGLSRRWRSAPRGRRFDLRRTLRVSLQTGGEALHPRWLRRPRRAPRFVLLIDGSRSMSAHADTALQMAEALASATTRLEVFTFSTALQRVTDDVRRAAAGQERRVEPAPFAWGGGTNIGGSLQAFLRRHGGRLLGRDTVVIVASDGLDVGDPAALGAVMAELRRRSAGIVWLNPLLDIPGYEPVAFGMSVARPYVATFAAVNDVPSFARLARTLRVRV